MVVVRRWVCGREGGREGRREGGGGEKGGEREKEGEREREGERGGFKQAKRFTISLHNGYAAVT